MSKPKDILEYTGLKYKTQPYVAYKRLSSLKKINTCLDAMGRKIFQANGPHKQAGVAILISDEDNKVIVTYMHQRQGHQ
jgi:hypothetical protein